MIALVLTLLAAHPSYYSPQEAQALFEQAGDAYYKESYAEAQANYQKLLDHGFGGPDVLFNLGTTELAKGDLGLAVLHLERARRLGGDPSDVEANLALARAKQLDKVVGATIEEPLTSRIADAFPGHALGFTFLIAWALTFASLLARRFSTSRLRSWAGAIAAGAFVVSISTAALLGVKAWSAASDVEAVVIQKSLPARALPEAGAKVAFEVHEGLLVKVLESAPGFVHIQLANGRDGWVDRASVERI
jgi:tetratricopeptide (TPR) repeat protein